MQLFEIIAKRVKSQDLQVLIEFEMKIVMCRTANVTKLYHELSSLLTDTIKFEDLKNKLALITVYTGDKDSFLYETGHIKKIRKLGKICRSYNLQTTITHFPSRSLVGRPKVPKYFIEDFREFSLRGRAGYRAFWVYKNNSIIDRINRSLQSERDVGILLGYPVCCVEEYVENKVKGIEIIFAALKKKAKTREEIKRLLYANVELQIELPDWNLVDKTIMQFPFVFHVACRDCLSGKSDASMKQNKQYEEIAFNVSKHFHDEVLKSSANIRNRG